MKTDTRPAHRRRVFLATVLAACALLTLATAGACSGSSGTQTATSNQDVQNSLSGAIAQMFGQAVPYPFASCSSSGKCVAQPPSDPLEMKNLARRLVQYNSRGDTNYVYLLTYTGAPVGYYVIQGKVSSTGSQMTSTQVNVNCPTNSSCTVDAPGDDGSYGPEEGGQNGIFFFTAAGALVETNDPFWIESSTPIPVYVNIPLLHK